MGSSAYISRIAAIAVAIGLGTAVTTGTGVAFAAEDEAPGGPPGNTSEAGDNAADPPAPSGDENDADDNDAEENGAEENGAEENGTDETDSEETDVDEDDLDDEDLDGAGDNTDAEEEQDLDVDDSDDADDDDGADGSNDAAPLDIPVNDVNDGYSEPQQEQTVQQLRVLDAPEPENAPPLRVPALPEPVTTLVENFIAGLTSAPIFQPRPVALAPAPAPQPLAAPVAGPTTIISTIFAAVGLSPLLNTTPMAPAQLPALWAVLAWVRRQFEQTLFNDSPSIAYVPGSAQPGLPGTVVGNLNVSDGDLDAEELDRLTYSQTGVDAGATLVINDDGTFVYTAPPGTTAAYEDTFTVTVSDRNTGFHLHGLLGFFQPGGGHTDSQTITVTVPAAAEENENTVVVEGTEQLPPGATITIPAESLPQYGDLEYEYDPATGELKYTLTVDLADQLRAGVAAAQQGQPQPLMRGMAFNALAAGDYQDSFTVTVDDGVNPPYDVTVNVAVPTKHFEIDDQGIDAGVTPVRVVFVGDYAYVMTIDQTPPDFPGTVRAIYVGELAEGEEPPAPVDIGVGNLPQWIEAYDGHVYVSSANGIQVIDTESNAVVDVIQTGGRPVFVHGSNGRLYVGHVDLANQSGPQEIVVLDVSDPDSPTFGEPVSDPYVVDGIPYGMTVVGDRLYVATYKLGTDPETGAPTPIPSIAVFDTDTGDQVDSVPLPEVTTTIWRDDTGRYLYIPGVQSIGSGAGPLYVYDTETEAFVDVDPDTDGIQHLTLPSTVTNVVFDEDNDIAYVGRFGDTISVIDTRTNEEITTVQVAPGAGQFQGLIVSEAPDGSVWVTDPFNNRLFVLRLVDGPPPAPEI